MAIRPPKVPSRPAPSSPSPPAYFGVGVAKDEEEEHRRQAAKRQCILAQSLQAHYDAIRAAQPHDDHQDHRRQQDHHEELQLQLQDHRNEESRTSRSFRHSATRHHLAVAMDWFMEMGADNEDDDESMSDLE